MSEHMFLPSRVRIDNESARAEIEAIAQRHDAEWTYTLLPGTGIRSWFSARNYGPPFDQHREDAVRAELLAIPVGRRLLGVTDAQG